MWSLWKPSAYWYCFSEGENSFRDFTLKKLNYNFFSVVISIASMWRTRYGSVHSFCSTGEKCITVYKFSRTLYNRELKFARIPVEICCSFYKRSKCLKIITFSMAAWYLLLMQTVYSMHFITVSLGKSVSFFRKISLFRQNNNWLSRTRSSLLKFSAQYSERGYVLWDLSTVWGPHYQDPRYIYCQRASRAETVGLRGCQLNATWSIAAGRKILDRAVKSVM